MRRLGLIILFLFSAVSALAQEAAEDYFHYKLEQHEPQDFSIATDTLLFYRLLHHRSDLYDELSAYRFMSVESGRRGFHFTARKALLEGVEMRRQNISLLRRLGVSERGYAGVTGGTAGVASVAGMDCFSLSDYNINYWSASFLYPSYLSLAESSVILNSLSATSGNSLAREE